MKRVVVLGSTGSIGKNAMKTIARFPEEFCVIAIAAKENIEELGKQIRQFSPMLVAVENKEKARMLQKMFPNQAVVAGEEGLAIAASHPDANFVVSAIAGTKGFGPTVAALQAGKDVALANKEALIAGGELVTRLAREKGATILPMDSEHAAIFQCLIGEDPAAVRRIILTASGGPFRDLSDDALQFVRVEDALRHPNWAMGPKVTIDCSTLMNKGLEVIEAHWLFNLPLDRIEVVIHPESIIHSLVEFIDGSMKAQLSVPTMEVPIQYAMMYPKRQKGPIPPFDFTAHPQLRFAVPDTKRFRCLEMAFFAAREGKSYPCYLNAANEVLVQRFIQQEISWLDISDKLKRLLDQHKPVPVSSLDVVMGLDQEARLCAATI